MHPATPRTSTEGARRRDEGDRVRFCRGARTTRRGPPRLGGAGGDRLCRAAPARDSMGDEISDSINGSMLNVKRNHTETSRRGRRCDGCATPPPTARTLCRPLRASTRVESGRAAVGRVHACRERSCCGRATRALRRSVDGDHTGCSGGRDRRIATAGALRTCDFALRGPVCSVPALHLSATASLSHP